MQKHLHKRISILINIPKFTIMPFTSYYAYQESAGAHWTLWFDFDIYQLCINKPLCEPMRLFSIPLVFFTLAPDPFRAACRVYNLWNHTIKNKPPRLVYEPLAVPPFWNGCKHECLNGPGQGPGVEKTVSWQCTCQPIAATETVRTLNRDREILAECVKALTEKWPKILIDNWKFNPQTVLVWESDVK